MCQRCKEMTGLGTMPVDQIAKTLDSLAARAARVFGASVPDYIPGTVTITYLDGTEESWTNVKDVSWDGADAFPELTIVVDDRTQVTIPLASIRKRTVVLPEEDPNL